MFCLLEDRQLLNSHCGIWKSAWWGKCACALVLQVKSNIFIGKTLPSHNFWRIPMYFKDPKHVSCPTIIRKWISCNYRGDDTKLLAALESLPVVNKWFLKTKLSDQLILVKLKVQILIWYHWCLLPCYNLQDCGLDIKTQRFAERIGTCPHLSTFL